MKSACDTLLIEVLLLGELDEFLVGFRRMVVDGPAERRSMLDVNVHN